MVKFELFFDSQLGIIPDLTGRENARLLASFIFPEFQNEHQEIIFEALEFSELGRFIDTPLRTYSNGMVARLCLSLITARPSEILILDEVFEGADEFFRKKMQPRMMQAIQNSGAVIFVSHQEEHVKAVANRALLIHDNKIVFDGNVDQAIKLYRQPVPSL